MSTNKQIIKRVLEKEHIKMWGNSASNWVSNFFEDMSEEQQRFILSFMNEARKDERSKK